jgi:hypothetical protein
MVDADLHLIPGLSFFAKAELEEMGQFHKAGFFFNVLSSFSSYLK